MRSANVLVVALGVVAATLAILVAWRWRNLPTMAAPYPNAPTSRAAAAVDALRTVGVVTSAGAISGLLCAGLVGRLVMRTLAATSGDLAQGQQTEAQETVGRISASGTFALVQFAGIFAGIAAIMVYLLLRRWLPTTAGPAGLAIGIVLVGTIGVLDPLSPNSVDFDLLKPRWLAVMLVIVTAALLGVSFSALTARLDQLSISPRQVRYAVYIGLVPMWPFVPLAAVYVGGRTLMHGRLATWLARTRPLHIGMVITRVVVAATLAITALAAGMILTG